MSNDWQPVVNAVLYMVQFSEDLNEAEVSRIATTLLVRPLGNLSPEQEYRALVAASNSSGPFDSVVRVKHSSDQIRRFLAEVTEQLDAERPRSEPAQPGDPRQIGRRHDR